MLRILVAASFATLIFASTANAGGGGGGGGAEPMPETNFTDLPSYHPWTAPSVHRNHVRRHVYGPYRSIGEH
jgi:hypothetical protein